MTLLQTTDSRGLVLSGTDAEGAAIYDALINDSYYYRLGVQDRLDRLLLVQWPWDLLAFRQHTGTLFWLGDKRYQAQIAASVCPCNGDCRFAASQAGGADIRSAG